MGRFDGRVAFITGGARGQGRAHALALAREGADVCVVDICASIDTVPYPLAEPDDLALTVSLIEQEGRRAMAVEADVRDGTSITAAVEATVEQLGSLDIAIANAGVVGFGRFWELTDEMWADMIAVNLTGTFNTMRAAVVPMLERGNGRIIATSSMAGRMGNPNLAHYVASKWGIIGLVKTLALEVASRGITVNAVCPAAVDTDMVHNPALYSLFCPDLVDPSKEEVTPRYEATNPMRVPWIDAEEVAAAVMYLASTEARHVTGSTVDLSLGSAAGMP